MLLLIKQFANALLLEVTDPKYLKAVGVAGRNKLYVKIKTVSNENHKIIIERLMD